jgi:hypothetical protein
MTGFTVPNMSLSDMVGIAFPSAARQPALFARTKSITARFHGPGSSQKAA